MSDTKELLETVERLEVENQRLEALVNGYRKRSAEEGLVEPYDEQTVRLKLQIQQLTAVTKDKDKFISTLKEGIRKLEAENDELEQKVSRLSLIKTVLLISSNRPDAQIVDFFRFFSRADKNNTDARVRDREFGAYVERVDYKASCEKEISDYRILRENSTEKTDRLQKENKELKAKIEELKRDASPENVSTRRLLAENLQDWADKFDEQKREKKRKEESGDRPSPQDLNDIKGELKLLSFRSGKELGDQSSRIDFLEERIKKLERALYSNSINPGYKWLVEPNYHLATEWKVHYPQMHTAKEREEDEYLTDLEVGVDESGEVDVQLVIDGKVYTEEEAKACGKGDLYKASIDRLKGTADKGKPSG